MPAPALEQVFASLTALAHGNTADADGTLGRMLAADLDAIAYVRIPQFPSSRAFGDAPVASIAEYRARIPADPSKAQIVPVPDRPFPAALRDADLLPAPVRGSDMALLVWSCAIVVGIPLLCWRWWRRRQRQRNA